MAHVGVVGSTNLDLTFRCDRLPRAGETRCGQSFALGFGGKGANQALMAVRLGARVTFVSRVGGDVFGELLLHNLRARGLDTTHVRVDSERTSGVATIAVDDAAQNSILVVPGANGGLAPQDVHDAAPALGTVSVLLCQLETPLDATLEAFRIARAAGAVTILNPAPAVPLPDELLHLTDLCVPNESEAEQLTGRAAGTPEQARAAAEVLLGRGVGSVLVTLGEHGALIADRAGVTHVPGRAVQAVDTSGAGDAFIGSLAVYLAEGQPLQEAACWANAAAALSVTRPGIQGAFPDRTEVEAFQRQFSSIESRRGVP